MTSDQDDGLGRTWRARMEALAEKAGNLANRVQSGPAAPEDGGVSSPSSGDGSGGGGLGARLQQTLSRLATKAESAADFVQMPSLKGHDHKDPLMDGAVKAGRSLSSAWSTLAPKYLPFADAASEGLPLNRLLRLSLFQVSVGMAMVLLTGTLNRVMNVEMGIPIWVVAVMIALPILFAPARVLIGFKSDNYRSFIGWRRVPFMWLGTLSQFLGLALMPFALFLLSAQGNSGLVDLVGYLGAAFAFLLVGLGYHTTQTAGIALATDLADEDKRPRVVALLYVMLLLGMIFAAIFYGYMLAPSASGGAFSETALVQTIQLSALITLVLNIVALWKQEPRNPTRTKDVEKEPDFRETLAAFADQPNLKRLLLAIFLGTAAFSMQDVLLEPYGGEMLGLSVSATTLLTAFFAFGSLVGFALSAKVLESGFDGCRLATVGLVVGVPAFVCLLLANPLDSALLYRVGSILIGFGGGLYAVGTLTSVMSFAEKGDVGLTLGAWGAVQATAMGGATMLGGAIKYLFAAIFSIEFLGLSAQASYIGYAVVYVIEIVLLFATLVVILPLARQGLGGGGSRGRFGLSGLPG